MEYPAAESNVVNIEPLLPDEEPGVFCDRLSDLVSWQLKNNPMLKGKTKKDIAAACYMSESCLKGMLNGKNPNPRIGSLKRLLRAIGGGDLNILAGLAPARDYNKESKTYDGSLMEVMQARLDEKKERIAALEKNIESLEGMLADERQKNMQLSTAIRDETKANGNVTAQLDALRDKVSERDSSIKWLDRALRNRTKLLVLIIAVALLILTLDLCMADVGWIQLKGLI